MGAASEGMFGRGKKGFWTVITNSSNSLIYPTEAGGSGRYSLDGFEVTDNLIFFNNFPAIKVEKGEEFRVWYGYDFVNYQHNNDGSHCVNVDVSCLV